MRTRWEHELRQYEYNLGRAAVASASAISSHGPDAADARPEERRDTGGAEHGSEVKKKNQLKDRSFNWRKLLFGPRISTDATQDVASAPPVVGPATLPRP
jgi:hypothetical protein